MAYLDEVSAQEIGRRLRLARKNADIRQDDAAQFIGVSRPTLVSIEQGIRRIRIRELQTLANYYGTSVNALLRREAVHTDLVPRFRKLRSTEHYHTGEAVRLLSDLVRAEVELENVLGIGSQKSYPPERATNTGDVVELAEQHAQDLRNWLGLGPGPLADVFTLIEAHLHIRLYQRRLASRSRVAGLFAYDPGIGACILLNANHPVERRVHSAVHEIGHFIGTRQSPEVLNEDEQFLSRDERYANAFGRAFLTPRTSFAESFRHVTAGSAKLSRRHVILLAHHYNISREGCVRRLEELGIVKKGSWDYFESNGGISNAQAQEVLGVMTEKRDPSREDADRPISYRLSQMAHAAWKLGFMSERQLAELLRLRHIELRAVIDEIELEENETGELLEFSR